MLFFKDDDKSDKTSFMEKFKKQEKRIKEELAKKGSKRKSDGHEENASKKRAKQGTIIYLFLIFYYD